MGIAILVDKNINMMRTMYMIECKAVSQRKSFHVLPICSRSFDST